ncbi:MAG: phosphoadenylyl-sulfate reductase [Acidimicrobiales bacterium]
MSTTEIGLPVTLPGAGLDLDELADISQRFETAAPSSIVAWAVEHFGDDIILASSFQDTVLIDIAVSVKPDIEVLFLDTQYHFAETLWFVDEVRARYDLNLKVVKPLVAPDNRWQLDLGGCCQVRKVEPLERGLAGKQGWLTGLRRDDSPIRANTPILAWDEARGMVKVNPLATWSAVDLEAYALERELLVHPLAERGYPSIGCWPCTRPVAPGDDPRSGRWAGSGKTECGLHTPSA